MNERQSVILHLPWPPSVNSANRYGKKGYFPSKEKKQFFNDADALYMMQARNLGFVKGRFTYHLVLNEKHRHPLSDGDNRCKYPLDYAQKVGLIENDRFAQGGSWSWRSCEYGAMLSIRQIQDETV